MIGPVPLNHVGLTVSDRERSAVFYGRHFGLTERVHDDEHLLILGSPDASLLALSPGPVPDGLPDTHFGFQVEDADEVRSARERLLEAGVTELEWQDDDGFVRVQVADPDGHRVELFAYGRGAAVATPQGPTRSRWTSFVADCEARRPRVLHEQDNPAHRLRVEHNRDTLLVHLSDEAREGWTVLAVDRATRRWAVAQARRQLDAAEAAHSRLYRQG
ncbi:MAG: VOC family protein [Actinomycetota bacterium]|nr:VOC family protein [Actinomycetota bacterium]